MKLSRIRFAFPWRIALILALLPCLPLLGFWPWFQWEVPPLQRYYLVAYWHSSETANQPNAVTQIQWLMETAPGRKRHWLFAFDVTEGSQNDLPLALSSVAAEQGWTGIERTPAESMDSTELEKLLREDFYDGKTFRQLMNEPLVYGVAAWVVIAYLAFMMRDDIGEEWRQLRREVSEPKWSTDYGDDWPDNRDGIGARIRSRFAHWIDERRIQLIWANFSAAISRRSSLDKSPNPESLRGSSRPVSKEVQDEVPTARRPATPLASNSAKPLSQRRTIFPGLSASDAAQSPSAPWDESKWIE
jgi:hypothetical protein